MVRIFTHIPSSLRRFGLLLLLGLVVTIFSSPGLAATLRYDVSVQSRQVVVGQTFRISCEIEAQGGSIEDLQLPDLGGLIQLGESRSQGSQISVVNGQMNMSRTLTVTLTVQADHAATFHIGAGTVHSAGKTAKSQAFDIVATGASLGASGGASGAASNSSPSSSSAGSNVGQVPKMQSAKSGVQSQAEKNSNYFVALELDRDSAYLGQQIIAELNVYSRRQISDVSAMQMPDFSGLVIEDLQSPRRINGRAMMISGRRYYRYMLRRIAMFPTQAGVLQIPSASIDVVVGGGFFSQGRSHKLRSEPLQVEVNPLPAQGQPAGFNPGNVGDYSLEVSVDSHQISIDKALTLSVTVKGQGNLRAVALPKIQELKNARLYPPNPSEDIRSTNTGIQGRKSYELLIQAEQPGMLHIPALKFHFFDPQHGEYHLASSQPINIKVSPGKQAENMSGVDKEQKTAALTSRARPVRMGPLCKILPSPWSQTQMTLLSLIAAASFVLLWLFAIILQRRRGSIRHQRVQHRQNAQKTVRQLSLNQPLDVDALALAIDAYIELCLRSPIKGLTRDQLFVQLGAHNFSDVQVQQVMDFYAWAEARRFAPGQDSSARPVAELVEALLQAVDAALPMESREAV